MTPREQLEADAREVRLVLAFDSSDDARAAWERLVALAREVLALRDKVERISNLQAHYSLVTGYYVPLSALNHALGRPAAAPDPDPAVAVLRVKPPESDR